MKLLLMILIFGVSSCLANEEQSGVDSFFAILKKMKASKSFFFKGTSQDVTIDFLNISESKSSFIKSVNFNYRVVSAELDIDIVNDEGLDKKVIAFKIPKDSNLSDVFKELLRLNLWHVESFENKALTINCWVKPQTEE